MLLRQPSKPKFDANWAERVCSARQMYSAPHRLLILPVTPLRGLSRVVVSAFRGTSAALAVRRRGGS
jgi:hypothetical protein